MTTTTIERPFTISGGGKDLPDDEERKVIILVEPGRVRLPGRVTNLHWHDAERLAIHLKEAAAAARVLLELKEQGVDIRLVCTRCDEPFREGVVTVEDPCLEGRKHHATGSPECRR